MLTSQKMMNSFSQSWMEHQNCQEETTNSEHPLWGGNNLQGVKISVEKFQANRKSLNGQNQQMTLKLVAIFGRFKVTSSIVITLSHGYNSMCRRKKHSLFHWNTLMLPGLPILIWMYVLQEKKIDDYWNVDSSKHFSDSWRGFTKFSLLKEKPPKGYMWSGRRLTKIQTTTRPDYVWPPRTKIGKDAQNREQKNGRKNSQNLTMLESWGEFTLTIQMTRRVFRNSQKTKDENLKDLMAPAMPCKRDQQHSSIVKTNAEPKIGNEIEFKTVYVCKVESHE